MKDKMFPCIQRPNTKEYEDNYDRIFRKELEVTTESLWEDKLARKGRELVEELRDECSLEIVAE